jgi:hypothetical protein
MCLVGVSRAKRHFRPTLGAAVNPPHGLRESSDSRQSLWRETDTAIE